MGVNKLVILPPLFLPWIGVFDMMNQADLFIILDNVQFSRQSWQQRNRNKTQAGVKWLTVPVKHRFGERIMNIKIDYSTDWINKHLKTIHYSYKGAPFFPEVCELLQRAYAKKPALLCQFNGCLLNDLRDYLGIKTPLILASDVPIENRGGKDHVLDLCKYFDAKYYLNGPLGKSLYSPEEFQKIGVDLVFHEFRNPVYSQLHGTFISHLSVVDMLFNCGRNTLELIARNNEKD